jgi:hypothetical protein
MDVNIEVSSSNNLHLPQVASHSMQPAPPVRFWGNFRNVNPGHDGAYDAIHPNLLAI